MILEEKDMSQKRLMIALSLMVAIGMVLTGVWIDHSESYAYSRRYSNFSSRHRL